MMDFKVMQHIYPLKELEELAPQLKPSKKDYKLINRIKETLIKVEGFSDEELDEIILVSVLSNDPRDVEYIKNSSDLCEQCGWCCKNCDPIIVGIEDIKRIGSLNNIDVHEDTFKMSVPCIYLDDENKCTIYDKRPNSCRTFPLSIKKLTLIVQRTPECEMIYKFLLRKVMQICIQISKKRD
jgi:Fe-S-cluster containining protein